jgi:glutamate synthase domain-containing protein 2/glutamate synthase domain-containing protein 3
MILSDREADLENPPLPMLLALRKVHLALNKSGLRLRTSLVVDSGEVKSSHELSTLIGFGASAVCPYLALECARYEAPSKVGDFSYEEKEQRLLDGFDLGLLKIMSKMGISAVRSYQSSELFNIIGLHQEVLEEFFPGHDSPIQGRKLKDIYKDLMSRVEHQEKVIQEKHSSLQNLHKFKEHARGSKGEEHSITTRRSKLIHQMLKEKDTTKSAQLYKEYALQDHPEKPVILRHLLSPKPSPEKLPIEQVEKLPEITRRFGTGAMSFGAISAESQRDLIEAMKEIGGRSNSGEGGENPYYYKEGITSSIKQVASGRFGVRAEYLVSGEEIQIKIAQGAKPGEGGQLMGVKVSDDIAKARFALPGTDLISPPPMHDIYSIEDLKGLIYEFKQLKPKAPVSVKLVSGHNIGNIAVGVVKAGADVIHISGGDGGTGAANLMSMKHAGLPLELGLYEVHRTLQENGLRNKVVLRADGSLQTGKDILLAALCGAQEFDFGKMLLVAEGCIMARVCEKNTCPTGIATQDPKYKKRYQGSKDEVVKYLQMIGEDLREWLSKLGYSSLESVIGRFDLIDTPDHLKSFLEEKNLEPLHFLVGKTPPRAVTYENDKPFQPEINELNRNILRKAQERWSSSDCYEHPESLPIRNEDRAIGATLSGYLAENWSSKKLEPGKKRASFSFHGSAGQGFGVFLTEGLHFSLLGDANDFVGKSMSGGNIVVKPREKPTQEDSSQAILGNACLYGATGGKLLACGFAGDRFAVRNSGALAVIEGAGWHACEYMTGGLVVILGQTYGNVGAGMTGGQLFLRKGQEHLVNREFLKASTIDEKDLLTLQKLFYEYKNDTQSPSIDAFLGNETAIKEFFEKWIPVKQT